MLSKAFRILPLANMLYRLFPRLLESKNALIVDSAMDCYLDLYSAFRKKESLYKLAESREDLDYTIRKECFQDFFLFFSA